MDNTRGPITIHPAGVAARARDVALALRAGGAATVRLYGVPRGGVPAALAVQGALWREYPGMTVQLTHTPSDATHIIDDLLDSGATRERYSEYGVPFHVLVDKTLEPYRGRWVVFPWEVTDEHDDSATDAVVRLLQYIGEDPRREGLRETPDRVLRAWREWCSGYGQDPMEVLKSFEDGAQGVDEMVLVSNIPVFSKCEHHMADIVGTAHVGYVPNGRILGISKVARLVEVYARRLQVQERLTNQIAEALHEGLKPKGVGVVIRAAHHCMTTRGVRAHNTLTTTSAMRGVMLSKPEARAEFLALCRDAEGHGT